LDVGGIEFFFLEVPLFLEDLRLLKAPSANPYYFLVTSSPLGQRVLASFLLDGVVRAAADQSRSHFHPGLPFRSLSRGRLPPKKALFRREVVFSPATNF